MRAGLVSLRLAVTTVGDGKLSAGLRRDLDVIDGLRLLQVGNVIV